QGSGAAGGRLPARRLRGRADPCPPPRGPGRGGRGGGGGRCGGGHPRARRMAEAMRREREAGSLARVYTEIEAPLVPVLLRMEEAGILLDVGYLKEMSVELGREVGELEAEIYQQAGERFN